VLGATNRPFDLDDAILRRMPRRILSTENLILVDLPNEESRKQIMKSNLKDELLADDIDLDFFAKNTIQYSGSDLKNVCVAAALARVKEIIAAESNMTGMTEEELKTHIDSIEDWGSYLSDKTRNVSGINISDINLNKSHLEIGLSECPPSLTEETQTLIELRKWDSLHGDGAAKRKKKATGYGFDVSMEKQ
jgi:SpoVK/Ycf46/Vps4 family AAA+-type ATPase